MSFLFGKKKQSHNALPPATSSPTSHGIKTKDRGPGGAQSPPPGPPPGSLPGPTPGGSVNNSINSISEAHAPSPDHGLDQRGGLEQDLPVRSLISISSHQSKCAFTRSEAFALGALFFVSLLTDDIACSLLLDQPQTELLLWTVTLPRSSHGPSDDLHSLHLSQTRSLDMARLSMLFHQKKGMCI